MYAMGIFDVTSRKAHQWTMVLLVATFLRRYVRYCARRRRFAAMRGAARLVSAGAARTAPFD